VSLVALASVKGSPGVTTTTVGIAASWLDDRPAVVAELDPAGIVPVVVPPSVPAPVATLRLTPVFAPTAAAVPLPN